MSAFWTLSALLILLAVGFAVWPLLKRDADPFLGQAKLLREQLAVLGQLEAGGLLAPADATSRKEALKAQLLALLEGGVLPVAGKRIALPTLLVLALLLPLATVMLYQRFGKPDALLFTGLSSAAARGDNQGTASSSATAGATQAPQQQGPDLRQAAEGLAQRLSSRPDDLEGWTLLGRTWQELGEFGKAAEAFGKAYAQSKEDPELLIDYAQALGLSSSPRSLLGQPRELLEAALKIAPQHQRGLWLYGFAQRQAGELEATLKTWDGLIGQLPAGSREAVSLTEQINVVRSELGLPPLAGADRPSAPVATAPEGATSAPAAPTAATEPAGASTTGPGLAVEVTLDPALSARLSPDDVLYVFARAKSGPPMPLAIQRVPATQLPFAVTLTDAMAMTPALKLSQFPEIVVGARVSKSGNAQASPGDLQGFSETITQPHGQTVAVVIREVVQ